jgi:hypothetical protein
VLEEARAGRVSEERQQIDALAWQERSRVSIRTQGALVELEKQVRAASAGWWVVAIARVRVNDSIMRLRPH